MGTIGNLAVNVTANTDKFSRGINSARHDATLFGNVAHNLAHQITHLATGFAAGLTIHKFVHDVEEASKSLTELGHDAKRLGASTEGLGGLEHAGALFHVSNETLIKDLTFMEKNLGKNADAFGKLGLSVSALKTMQADEAFVKIAGAIDKLPTAADKTAASMAVFGKGGAEMLKLLTEGREGLTEAMEEAKRLGLAPNEEQLKKMEKEDQAVQRLKESYRGLGYTIAMSVAHRAGVFADNLTRMLGGDSSTQPKWQKFVDQLSQKDFADVMATKAASPSGTNTGDILKSKFGMERNGNDIAEFNVALHRREERDLAAAEGARNSPFTESEAAVHAAQDWVTKWSKSFASGATSYINSSPESKFLNIPQHLPSDANNRWWMKHRETKADKDQQAADEWNAMGGAQFDRISNNVDEMIAMSRDPQTAARHYRPADQIHGNAALEQGTAAAFSQSRRSQQASSLVELTKKQLDEDKIQTKALQSIDKNIKATQNPVTVNIA